MSQTRRRQLTEDGETSHSADIPCDLVSSGGVLEVFGEVGPGDLFVVVGLGLQTAVKHADEPVAELAKRGAVADAAGAEL
jgi:hypothetical protein